MARYRQHQPWIRRALSLYAGLVVMHASSPCAQTVPDPVSAKPATTPPVVAAEPIAALQDRTGTAAPAAVSSDPRAGQGADKGEIVVEGSMYARHDPFHSVNQASYNAIQKSDALLVAPATRIYTRTLPSPIRRGLHNAMYNLREPTNVVASVMEHKFGRAGQALVRFTVNSTIGLAGLIDVAKARPLHLAYRPNGLADVAGFYGIKPGPYFFLPLVGPTTLRDVIGVTVDRSWFLVVLGAPFNGIAFGVGETAIGGLDDREAVDGQLRALRAQSGDPYRATRDFYMKRRQQEIDELRHPGKGKSKAMAEGGVVMAPAGGNPVASPAPRVVPVSPPDRASLSSLAALPDPPST